MDPHASRLTVLYDADCRICTRVAGRLAGLDRGRRLRLLPLQRASADRPEVSAVALSRDLAAELHVVAPDGRCWSGGQAVLRVMELVPGLDRLARLARHAPFDRLVEPAYRFVAGHRHLFAWLAGDFGTRHTAR